MEISNYWDSFYATGSIYTAVPSQFAVLVLRDFLLHPCDCLIDISCGNARDT